MVVRGTVLHRQCEAEWSDVLVRQGSVKRRRGNVMFGGVEVLYGRVKYSEVSFCGGKAKQSNAVAKRWCRYGSAELGIAQLNHVSVMCCPVRLRGTQALSRNAR